MESQISKSLEVTKEGCVYIRDSFKYVFIDEENTLEKLNELKEKYGEGRIMMEIRDMNGNLEFDAGYVDNYFH